jgi:hypothetical protein
MAIYQIARSPSDPKSTARADLSPTPVSIARARGGRLKWKISTLLQACRHRRPSASSGGVVAAVKLPAWAFLTTARKVCAHYFSCSALLTVAPQEVAITGIACEPLLLEFRYHNISI